MFKDGKGDVLSPRELFNQICKKSVYLSVDTMKIFKDLSCAQSTEVQQLPAAGQSRVAKVLARRSENRGLETTPHRPPRRLQGQWKISAEH